MLSDHELTIKIRDDLYPHSRKIEDEILNLFNMQWPCRRGPTGVTGEGELSWTIEYLRSAANMLEKIGKHRGIL
jgi:hypothetical protein